MAPVVAEDVGVQSVRSERQPGVVHTDTVLSLTFAMNANEAAIAEAKHLSLLLVGHFRIAECAAPSYCIY